MGKSFRNLPAVAVAALCVVGAVAAPISFAQSSHHKHTHKHSSAHKSAPRAAASSSNGVVSYAGGLVTVYPATGGTSSGVYSTAVGHGHTHAHASRVNYVHPPTSYYHSAAVSAGDYLGAMGGESRWAPGKVIRVYVAPGKPTYPGIVASCFNQWSAATGGKIRWQRCSDPNSADYCVTWTRRQKEISEGTEAGLTTTDTDPNDESGKEIIIHADTSVLTRYEGKQLSDSEVEKTILHEVGHGLGLEGHSPSEHDIMYYAVSPKQTEYLSGRDKNTINRLYTD